MISDDDIDRIMEACSGLPEPAGDYSVDDYLTNLVATVVDFQTHTTAVEKALEQFTVRVRPTLRGVEDLVALMSRWPADQPGNTALAKHLWGYSMWTRAQMLRDLVSYFVHIGVTDEISLREWATQATFEDDFEGRVRGLGRAVFQWLVMRQGIETIKPDVHIHRFVTEILGRRVSDIDAVSVVVAAARRLGRSARRVDWAIWEISRAKHGVAGQARSVPVEQTGPATAAARGTEATPNSDLPTSFIDDDPG